MDTAKLNERIHREVGRGAHSRVFEIVIEAGSEPRAFRIENAPREGLDKQDQSVRLARLPSHPNLLEIMDAGRLDDGRHWQLMPLLRPVDAHELVGSVGPTAALSLLIQAAAGLSVLHGAGFIHGDLKPGNILVEAGDTSDAWRAGRVVLADLDGLSPALRSPGDVRVTGSLGYLAPELISGESSSSSTSDIFSLGLWVVWIVTGSEPFANVGAAESLQRLARFTGPDPLGRIDGRFGGRFWSELMPLLLAAEPAGRLQDGRQVIQFILDRSHLIPSLDERLGELLWNPTGLSRQEIAVLDDILLTATSTESGADATVVTGIHPRRIRESARYLAAGLGAPPWATLVLDAESSAEALVHGMEAAPFILAIDLTSLARPSSSGDMRSQIDTWNLSPTMSGSRRFPPVIFVGDKGAAIVESLTQKLNVLTRTGLGTSTLIDASDRAASRFSGVAISPLLAEQLERRTLHGSATLERVLLDAMNRGWIRASGAGISVAPEEVEGLLSRHESMATDPGTRFSPRARALFDVLSCLPDGLTYPALAATENSESWTQAAADLIEEATARQSRDRVSLSIPPSSRTPIDLTVTPEMLELATLLQAIDPGSADFMAARISKLRSMPPDEANLSAVIEYARRLYSRRLFPFAIAVLRRPPESLFQEGQSGLEGKWMLLLGKCFLAVGEEVRAIIAFERVQEICVDRGRWRSAARMAFRTALLEMGLGRKTGAMTMLERALERSSRVDGPNGRRLARSVRAEIAFVQRAERDPTDLVTECRQLLVECDGEHRTRACLLRVLADVEHRAGRIQVYRGLAAATICEVRRTADAEAKARFLQSFASFEFSNGNYARASNILRVIGRLPQHRLKTSDRSALLSGLGGIAYEEGRFADALRLNLQLLATCRREMNALRVSIASLNVALILRDMGRFASALSMTTEAAELLDRAALPHLSDPFLNQAEILLLIGANARAESVLLEWGERHAAQARGNRIGLWHLLNGQHAAATGKPEEARRFFREATAVYSALSMVDEIAISRLLGALVVSPDEGGHDRESLVRELLDEYATRVGWRARIRLQIGQAQCASMENWEACIADLDQMSREIAARGFLSMDLELSAMKARALIEGGWLVDAQDAIRMAVDRIRLTAGEFRDPALRAAYLSDPRRLVFQDLALRSRGG